MRYDDMRFCDTLSGSYSFYWGKPEAEHELLTGERYELVDKSVNKRITVDDTPPWLQVSGVTGRPYFPLKDSTLHRKFARLFDEESLLKFADRYGELGEHGVMLIPREGGPVVVGESLLRWRYESESIGVTLAFWDLVRQREAGKLGQLLIWDEDYLILRFLYEYDERRKQWRILPYKDNTGAGLGPPNSRGTIFHPYRKDYRGVREEILASPFVRPVLLDRWTQGQVLEPAKYYVCTQVNSRLSSHVSPQVFPFLEGKVYLRPDSLCTAVWLLLSNEIMGNLRVRQCDMCGEWKEVHRTRSAFYCSTTCRVKAHRLKKEHGTKEAQHEGPHSQEVQE